MVNTPGDQVHSTISGGTQIGPVIMGRDFRIALPTPVPLALAQLPPLVAGFTGREEELEVMTRLLNPAETTGTVVVSAIAGLAGVGKSSLAVQAGHAARERAWFPGGMLFIDLHGYDEAPVQPAQALGALLRALGISAEHIPPTAEERAALYRSVLTGITNPVLLIADNVSSDAQVRPLLPGPGPHRIIITSRHTLASLQARLVDINILNDADSVILLDVALRSTRPDDDRISSDAKSAGRLAKICGGLPLALQIAAALLKGDPTLNVSELTEELAEERNRLERLRYDDDSGLEVLSVEAAFELSYRRLNAVSTRVFRMLPVNSGPDVSTDSAVVLADQSFFKVRKSLSHLAQAHMIEATPGVAGHWRMHDLMRLYAQRLSDAYAKSDRRDQARYRLLNYYLKRTRDASHHLMLFSRLPGGNEFARRDDALAWLDTERSSLVAAVSMADRSGKHQIAFDLSSALFEYLRWCRYLDECVTIAATGLDAARALNDRSSEAGAMNNLGLALQAVRRFDEAVALHRNAVKLAKAIGDRHLEGASLHNLGMALENLRLFNDAIAAYQQDLAICREFGDLPGEGMTLNSLAICLNEARQPEKAIEVSERAVGIFRAVDHRQGEGMALNNAASALRVVGNLEAAIVACKNGSHLLREIGDRYHEAAALVTLSGALCDAGRYDEATVISEDAATIFREIGDRHGEGKILGNLAGVLLKEGRLDKAIAADRKSLDIFVETGDKYLQGKTLRNLGIALKKAQHIDEAISALRDAVAMFRETSDRHEEGEVLKELGIVLSIAGQFNEAITAYQDAVSLLQVINDKPNEGNAMYNLGITFREAQRFDEAISALRAAASIFHVTGEQHDEGEALNALTALLGGMGEA